MGKVKLRSTHGVLNDVLQVKAVNATVRYDGTDAERSNTYDILLDCSARIAMERLEVCTDHRHGLKYVTQDKNSGIFRTQGRGLLAFEYNEIPDGLLIITASCGESGKSDEEVNDCLGQALDRARDHAEKRFKSLQ